MAAARAPLLLHCDLWKLLQLSLLTVNFWIPFSETAAVALNQYTMDQKSDCISAGVLDIPRGQVTRLTAPSRDVSTSAQVLSCRLQFSSATEGDTLKLSLEPGAFFEDCDVALELQMTNYEKIILGCKSNAGSVPKMEAVNGKASIWLSRRQFDDISYWFQISVTSVKTEMNQPQGGSNTADVGLIVGIIAGVIVLLVIAIIICIFCYRKRRTNEKEKYKENTAKNSHSTSIGHGYENNMAKISYDDSLHKSPGSDRRLLVKNDENNDKPKSALERFGLPLSQQGRSNVESKIAVVVNDEYKGSDSRKKEIKMEKGEIGKHVGTPAEKTVIDAHTERQPVPKSRILTAVHNNPRFQKTFQDTEVDAEERLRKISDHNSFTNSSASLDSENMSSKKPNLPPVPISSTQSPSLQRQRKNSFGVYQTRPSSSSSEMARFEDEESDEKSVDKHKQHDSHNNRTNKVSGPNNRGGKISDRKLRDKNNSKRKNMLNEEEGEENRNREKYLKDENKLRKKHKRQEDGERKRTEDKEGTQKREGTTRVIEEDDDRSKRKERDGEYEGRFKKSSSGRKPKGKGQKMGRSRSAGNALEELDSNYHRSRSKSPSSVRSFILAEDDNDYDEQDSNITSFRRSGSKMSLYASRSSLYGRKRKNSMGETVSMSSYAYDDVDSRIGDFDKTSLTHREKERLVRSTGDLHMGSVVSAVVFRECATQTGNEKEVYIYGRRTYIREQSSRCYNRGTQTTFRNERRNSVGSNKSGRSSRSYVHSKSRSKSQESLRKEKHSRSRDFSVDNSVSERSYHQRSLGFQNKDYSDSEDTQSYSRSDTDNEIYSPRKGKQSQHKPRKDNSSDGQEKLKYRSKPVPISRKSKSVASNDISVSDDQMSTVNSSIATSHPDSQQEPHVPYFIPAGYPVIYPQSAFAYVPSAPGGPPTVIPITAMPQSAVPQNPSVVSQPNVSKWDQLVNLTEGMKKRRHQMGESIETGSVLSSAWSQPIIHSTEPKTNYSLSSYTATRRMPKPGSSYGSVFPESVDAVE